MKKGGVEEKFPNQSLLQKLNSLTLAPITNSFPGLPDFRYSGVTNVHLKISNFSSSKCVNIRTFMQPILHLRNQSNKIYEISIQQILLLIILKRNPVSLFICKRETKIVLKIIYLNSNYLKKIKMLKYIEKQNMKQVLFSSSSHEEK